MGFGVDRSWRVWVISLVVWVTFRSAVVGFLWGWLVVDGDKATERSKYFFLLRSVNLGVLDVLINWVWFWIRILS